MRAVRNHLSARAFFALCATLLVALFYPPFLILGRDGGGAPYAAAAMFSPALAGLITRWVYGLPWRAMGLRLSGARAALGSALIPVGYLSLAYGAVWALGLAGYDRQAMVAALQDDLGMGAEAGPGAVAGYFALFVGLQVLVAAILAFGEELGWRGVWVPQLYARYGFARASVISGVYWGLWHVPLFVFGCEDLGVPLWYAIPSFLWLTTAISFVYTWYRLHSGSVWTAVLLHAVHNALLMNVFMPSTIRSDLSPYLLGETGVALPVLATLLAFWVYRRRGALPASSGGLRSS